MSKGKGNSIQRFEQLPAPIKAAMQEAGEEFKIGDMFFSGDHIIRIREITKQKDYEKKVYYNVHTDHALDFSGTEWSSWGTESVERFLERMKSGEHVKIDRPLAELQDEAQRLMRGEIDMQVYYQSEHDNVGSDEMALISRSSKEGLLAIQQSLEAKKRSAELVHKAIKFEMEKKRQEMEMVRKTLYGAVEKFMKQVKRIMRVVTTIELYLGIEEEIVQIQEGEKAPADTPLHFRQLVLFMDEEVGLHQDGGLDFSDIKVFDEWLTTGNNIDIVLPEKKGIVVLRPRRTNKDYGDAYLNATLNLRNRIDTYILIRNGDCLYRIYTEKLVIMDRLFPRRTEMAELVKRMQETSWDRDKEKIEDEMYQYQKRAVLLQGLVDRTEVFHPLPVERLSIFKMHEHENLVHFIYDDDMMLPSGRKAFWKWHADINKKIEHGSRVIITSFSRSGSSESEGRIYYYTNNYPTPPRGLFEVEEHKVEEDAWLDEDEYQKALAEGRIHKVLKEDPKHRHELKNENPNNKYRYSESNKVYFKGYKVRYIAKHLTVLYNPYDTVYGGWGSYESHERKKRIRWRIFKGDQFVINYDQISLDDIEFYLHSRVDRRNYLGMMPVLKDLKKKRLEELNNEKAFADLLFRRNTETFLDDELHKRIQECINWWKYKNQWKRPIDKDDTKALRMIEERMNSRNYHTFKKYNKL